MRRALADVRQRLVDLMREDPPFRLLRGAEGPILDGWLATRLRPEELRILENREGPFSESALAELFAEALREAGGVRPSVSRGAAAAARGPGDDGRRSRGAAARRDGGEAARGGREARGPGGLHFSPAVS